MWVPGYNRVVEAPDRYHVWSWELQDKDPHSRARTSCDPGRSELKKWVLCPTESWSLRTPVVSEGDTDTPVGSRGSPCSSQPPRSEANVSRSWWVGGRWLDPNSVSGPPCLLPVDKVPPRWGLVHSDLSPSIPDGPRAVETFSNPPGVHVAFRLSPRAPPLSQWTSDPDPPVASDGSRTNFFRTHLPE